MGCGAPWLRGPWRGPVWWAQAGRHPRMGTTAHPPPRAIECPSTRCALGCVSPPVTHLVCQQDKSGFFFPGGRGRQKGPGRARVSRVRGGAAARAALVRPTGVAVRQGPSQGWGAGTSPPATFPAGPSTSGDTVIGRQGPEARAGGTGGEAGSWDPAARCSRRWTAGGSRRGTHGHILVPCPLQAGVLRVAHVGFCFFCLPSHPSKDEKQIHVRDGGGHRPRRRTQHGGVRRADAGLGSGCERPRWHLWVKTKHMVWVCTFPHLPGVGGTPAALLPCSHLWNQPWDGRSRCWGPTEVAGASLTLGSTSILRRSFPKEQTDSLQPESVGPGTCIPLALPRPWSRARTRQPRPEQGWGTLC